MDIGPALFFGEGGADSFDVCLEELTGVVSAVTSEEALLAPQVLIERTAMSRGEFESQLAQI